MKKQMFQKFLMAGLICVTANAMLAQNNNELCKPISTNKVCVTQPSMQFTTVTGQTVVCVSNNVSLTASYTNINGETKTTFSYDNCPDVVTNLPASAGIQSSSWEVSGPGSFCTNGNGLDASFTPTNCGSGTVTFHLSYTNSSPCSETADLAISKDFSVEAVSSLTSEGTKISGTNEPAVYRVCPCGGDAIITAADCLGLNAADLPGCWTFTGGVEIDRKTHKIAKTNLLNGPVTFTVTAGSSTKTIILKSDLSPQGEWSPIFVDRYCLKGGGVQQVSDTYQDQCGNTLYVNCEDGTYYTYYNETRVGRCCFRLAENYIYFRKTMGSCRFHSTWHCTADDAWYHPFYSWIVFHFDCISETGDPVNCLGGNGPCGAWLGSWGNPNNLYNADNATCTPPLDPD